MRAHAFLVLRFNLHAAFWPLKLFLTSTVKDHGLGDREERAVKVFFVRIKRGRLVSSGSFWDGGEVKKNKS